ncbi:MAG: STAS domain-containing protein [Leptonema sp. (in: bacteria)]
MLIKFYLSDQKAYFRLEEDLKMENAPVFYENFIREVELFYGKQIFLDFSKLTFVDSSGIGSLLRISDFLKGRNSKLFIVGINKAMSAVFKLAGLYQIFNIIEKNELKNYLTKEELEKLY